MGNLNDEIANKVLVPEADTFLASVPELVLSQSNFDKINATLAQHRLPITAAGFRAAYEAIKDKLELKPPPAPAPKKYRGSQLEILEQAGYKPTTRESPDELAAAARERANKVRSSLEDLRDSAQRQKDAEQRFAEENQVVYIENGPHRGKIDHSKTESARAEARRRWAKS